MSGRTRDSEPVRGQRTRTGRATLRDDERIARRRELAAKLVPISAYPEELPVSQRRDEIAAAIRDHQVVVVAGETGSGKTTQLPKICLDLGRGVRGAIGHTQPRRIAARSVADRIAEELGVELGGAVGYRVRFGDHAGEDTLVRLMTDGILLAETRHDPLLLRYDTVIVDEAHERSLNIDFLLGYLTRLLPRRPDLKVVITSATIDPERFSRHFGGAPIVEVSGRTYPVEIRYRPYGPGNTASTGSTTATTEADERDQTQAIVDAIDELDTEPGVGPGDVLVFLSGEREIRDTADALRRLSGPESGRGAGRATEIVPLYARLSTAEQHRVFAPHAGRRIVLATNVAETSLTVPGIRYVVDPGTARISRYSRRTKVQRLPIEPISQASARQRAGRCGRLSDGICIRLYAEEDFQARPAFTEPEIMRTNLASVLLQMAALNLGDVEDFPFVDPPDRRSVRDGVALLSELGAFSQPGAGRPAAITPLGRRLARLPLDPRIGRMILAAADTGCVAEVLVIAAGLTILDPRERPSEPAAAKEAAAQQHARFADPTSDFLAYLNLWKYLTEQQQALSSSAFRRLCRTEFLHYLRVREWQDLHGHLRTIVRGLGIHPNDTPAPPETVHRALLAGLLSQIGQWDPVRREYLGARGIRFAAAPGSAAARKPPRWLMAAELVETSRMWARTTAAIQPEWVEPLAEQLVDRSYSEPRWDARRGSAVATEKVTLFGLPVVTARTVAYGSIDPVVSRDLFLRHALVQGEWDMRPPTHAFVRVNLALRDELREVEERTRRRGLVADDDTLYALYDERIPADVVSTRHFDSWWRKERRDRPDLLTFDRADLLTAPDAGGIDDFPGTWQVRPGTGLPLTYNFDPGAPDDGVTLHVPVALLPEVSPDALEWQVPGLREELVTALIRSLPKALRRSFVPVPTYASAALERIGDDVGRGSLLGALAGALTAFGGPRVTAEDFDLARVPDHLRMAVRVVGERDRTLATGRDLADLQRRYAPTARTSRAAAAVGVERTGLTDWTIDDLPRAVEVRASGHPVTAYPALVDEGATVGVRVFTRPEEQAAAMARGTRRLLLLTTTSPAATVAAGLDSATKLLLMTAPHGGAAALMEDVRTALVDAAVAASGGPAWDREGFRTLRSAVDAAVRGEMREAVLDVARVLHARREVVAVEGRLPGRGPWEESLADVRLHVERLVCDGFVADVGVGRLPDLVRYLRAAALRLERLVEARRDPARAVDRDLAAMDRIHALEDSYAAALEELPAYRRRSADAQAVRWMIEEMRISLFAPGMRTAYPVSEKRIGNALAALRTGTS